MTILLCRTDVASVLPPPDCIAAVEDALRRSALGEVPPPATLGMAGAGGSFHVKAGRLDAGAPYFAAKVNANFPANPARHGLPTIQGAVLLFDAGDGRLLAILDSMALTAARTAAATALAAKHLARPDAAALLLVGCGAQALPHLRALACVRPLRRFRVHDVDAAKAIAFAQDAAAALGLEVQAVADPAAASGESDIVVTCTPARQAFLTRGMLRPGTFVAAVGADHEDKHEVAPAVLAAARVVTDSTPQAARIGDLHHAIEAGAMRADEVHAELGEVVAGLKPGRIGDEELTVFDSTGTGLLDVAAAVAAYRRAVAARIGTDWAFDA